MTAHKTGEPVAWRYRNKRAIPPHGDWILEDTKPTVAADYACLIEIQPLYAHPPVAQPFPNLLPPATPAIALDRKVDEYVSNYVFRGDDGDYQPTSDDLLMLSDAIHGFIAECEPVAQPCDHKWSCAASDSPEVVCTLCGTPKVAQPLPDVRAFVARELGIPVGSVPYDLAVQAIEAWVKR